jgi:hypothetical protein
MLVSEPDPVEVPVDEPDVELPVPMSDEVPVLLPVPMSVLEPVPVLVLVSLDPVDEPVVPDDVPV